jgi:dipeptidyl aminopeptidase/acylaminoacyl peptidase
VIDTTPDDPGRVLISVAPWTTAEAYTRVERMDTSNGTRKVIARAPVRRAQFVTDHDSVVRFAVGAGIDNVSKLYYRADDEAEWQLVNDEASSGRIIAPIGFSADNRTAYLQAEEAQGPDAVYAYDTATGKMTRMLGDDAADPADYEFSPFDDALFAVQYMDGKPRYDYFDPESPAARLHRSLLASFDGQSVSLGTTTRDRSKGLIITHGDRNPGDVYLFDYSKKGAQFLLALNERLDVQALAPMQPIALKARDGRALHGYLTAPNGQERNMPLVVMPHGGPFGIRDSWGYDPDVQMLANRGYAVLQVNFRGSGGYGREFLTAGFREWGGAMQHDVTDATRWAIEQGIADPQRICIYGASYGGYAALMGVASEPDLYRCAIGHIGVYDLKMMYTQGDVQDRLSGETYLEDTLGKDGLEERSPSRLADRIKVPVLLTAGAEDDRAPPEHTERMAEALRKAGKPVDSKIYKGEGHGFYVDANRIDHAERVLAFLDQHIGAKAAAAGQD